jgi:signal recognition particle GTPase
MGNLSIQDEKSSIINSANLIINLNEEFKIKIEDGNQFNSSIFKDVYREALKNVIEIAKQSDINENSNYDDFNNVIAFTGERGKGKSSSMISFRDALIKKDDPENFKFFKYQNDNEDIDYHFIQKKIFTEIDIIDPSLFRGGESLFEMILAKMFKKFQEEIKRTSNKVSNEDRRLLIDNFQEVFKNLQIINSDRKELYKKESIEALSKLATSSNLRERFKKLVDIYLDKFQNHKDYLIIAIDDFDLNIVGAYDMLEDIRQFLIQPKIILLIACKVEQLNDSIINTLALQYRSLSEFYNYNKNINLNSNIENIRYPKISQSVNYQGLGGLYDKFNLAAFKYIEKLFPLHRTIHLPELYVNDKNLSLYIGDDTKLNNIELKDILSVDKYIGLKEDLISDKLLFQGDKLSFLLSEFVYAKTFFFINVPKHKVNVVFPKNLRGVLNFLSLSKKSNTKYELKKYILDIAKFNLEKDFYEIFNILENQSIETLNITLVNCIGKNKEKFGELNINHILFSKNPTNVSVGDVNTIFYAVNNQLDYSNANQILFIELLNIYYSLRISELQLPDSDLQAFYYSNSISIFRISSFRRRRRDYIIFEGLSVKSMFDKLSSNDDKFWLSNFFSIFGKYQDRYRTELYTPFFKPMHNVSNGVFAPLAIFNNILFPEHIIRQLNIQDTEQMTLYNQVVEWNKNENNLNNLLKNSMFYLELLDLFDKESRSQHKSEGMMKSEDGDEIYFEILYDYFTNSLERALSSISEKYCYLGIDSKWWIENNPILNYWKKIFEDKVRLKVFREIFQDIYTSQDPKRYTKEEADIAKMLLKSYSDYFRKDQSNNSRGAKQAMTSLYKAFHEESDLYVILKDLRDSMDNNLQEGLSNIEKLLKNIK